MRCIAVCQPELVIRMLDEALVPSFEVEFLVESKPVARRLHDANTIPRLPQQRGQTAGKKSFSNASIRAGDEEAAKAL